MERKIAIAVVDVVRKAAGTKAGID